MIVWERIEINRDLRLVDKQLHKTKIATDSWTSCKKSLHRQFSGFSTLTWASASLITVHLSTKSCFYFIFHSWKCFTQVFHVCWDMYERIQEWDIAQQCMCSVNLVGNSTTQTILRGVLFAKLYFSFQCRSSLHKNCPNNAVLNELSPTMMQVP